MKQPKFKFGDKIFYSNENPFVIEKIRWSDCYQQYEYNDNCLESVVQPYQEPVKRKLYAYVNSQGKTVFNIAKDVSYPDANDDYMFERCEKYDIEYLDD